jgi:hypothetical protein
MEGTELPRMGGSSHDYLFKQNISTVQFERHRSIRRETLDAAKLSICNLQPMGWRSELNQIRSFRCLEAECRRNVELMWLLGPLYPDH